VSLSLLTLFLPWYTFALRGIDFMMMQEDSTIGNDVSSVSELGDVSFSILHVSKDDDKEEDNDHGVDDDSVDNDDDKEEDNDNSEDEDKDNDEEDEKDDNDEDKDDGEDDGEDEKDDDILKHFSVSAANFSNFFQIF
jgi:hypothetical protein